MRLAGAIAGLLCLIGCGNSHSSPSAPVAASKAPVDPWILATLDSQAPAPAYLSNGLIGVRVGRGGNGFYSAGKPLPFLMIDDYQPDGEEKILPLPNPLLVTIAIGNSLFNGGGDHDFMKSGGEPLNPELGRNYRQSLDMRTGVLTTTWTQDTKAGGSVSVGSETVIDPSVRTIAQRWTLKTANAASFAIRTLDYGGPNDEQRDIGGNDKTGIYASASDKRGVAMRWSLGGAQAGALSRAGGFTIQEGSTVAGKPAAFERVLSFGPRPNRHISAGKVVLPKAATYEEVSNSALAYWSKAPDIEIDGPVEDQQAVRSMLFYLRSSVNAAGEMSVSPFALSDTQYNGHVFWDADTWVFPALALIAPDKAKAIADYRIQLTPAAHANDQAWRKKGRPTASDPITGGGVDRSELPTTVSESAWNGLKYPWESSVSGKETVPGPSRFEEHISGSVAWAMNRAYAVGLADKQARDETIAGVGNYYAARAARLGDGQYGIRGTMSPDENHTGDDDLYTNLLAEWTVNGGRFDGRAHFYLPHDDKGLLTYDGDRLRGYKQAAAVLAIYPLQYPPAEAQGKQMMDRFSGAVIANGPAMTDSLHALIWARLGERDKAYQVWRKSWMEFTKSPLLLFSEKRTRPTTYFVTGAAGCIQTVLYGFLGFRIDSHPQPGAAWSQKLVGDSFISVKPNLPSSWKSVKFHNFLLLGKRHTLIATPSSAKLTSGD